MLFDLEVKASSITLDGLGLLLLDVGQHAIAPDQTGNKALINIYTHPTTWDGFQQNINLWTLVGVGVATVVDGRVGYSPVTGIVDPVSGAAVTIPTGSWGVAVEVVPTNANVTPPQTGPNAANAGLLHAFVVNQSVVSVKEDQFIKIDNDALFTFGWHQTGTGPGPFPLLPATVQGQQGGSLNFTFDYSPPAGDAATLAYGEGCYSDPSTTFESFVPSAADPSLVDGSTPIGGAGGMSFLNQGNNYFVSAATVPYVPPTSPNLLMSPPGQSLTGTWKWAISSMYQFPASWGGFAHPGGSATQFGVTSTGSVYLDAIGIVGPQTLIAPMGSLTGLTQDAPSICGFRSNVDATLGGGIYVDIDPSDAWVRVTWEQLQEDGIASSVNTFQLTMYPNGGFDLCFVDLSNEGTNNHAICGYFEGNGAPVGDPINWNTLVSSAAPFTGSGATAPVLRTNARPQIGTSVDFVTDDLAAGTLGGVLFFAASSLAPTNLAILGAPDCYAHVNIATGLIASLSMSVNASNQLSLPLAIPNNPVFLASTFHAQTITLLPGVNAFGTQTSNGLCVNVGH